MFSEYTLRKTILLNKLKEKRNQSASLIQMQFKNYLMRKDLYALAKNHRNYYSIYPTVSIDDSFNDDPLVEIKLYLDLNNSKVYKVLPVRFCLLRNCFVFDIHKVKFSNSKKLMRFNFIINGKTFIDPNYKSVIFENKYVNEIDFNKFETKKKDNKKICKNKIINVIYNSKDKNKININYNKNKLKKAVTAFTELDTLNNSTTTGSSSNSFKDFGNLTSKRMKRKKSILKIPNIKRLIEHDKRVTFGVIKYSY